MSEKQYHHYVTSLKLLCLRGRRTLQLYTQLHLPETRPPAHSRRTAHRPLAALARREPGRIRGWSVARDPACVRARTHCVLPECVLGRRACACCVCCCVVVFAGSRVRSVVPRWCCCCPAPCSLPSHTQSISLAELSTLHLSLLGAAVFL